MAEAAEEEADRLLLQSHDAVRAGEYDDALCILAEALDWAPEHQACLVLHAQLERGAACLKCAASGQAVRSAAERLTRSVEQCAWPPHRTLVSTPTTPPGKRCTLNARDRQGCAHESIR